MSTKRRTEDIDIIPGGYVDEDRDNILGELEEQEEREGEEAPEAFIPSFTVAPEEIPIESQVHIPTEQEKAETLDSLYKKLGVKARQFIEQEPQIITPEKERFVQSGSKITANIFSAVFMWGFSIFGIEYGALAPSVEQSQAIVTPVMRIVARHSKIVSNVSPDIDDAVEAAKALSDYLNSAMYILDMIREDKARNNGQSTVTFQTRPSDRTSRHTDNRRYAESDTRDNQDTRVTSAEPTDNLTDDQRRNRDALLGLAQRDYEYRARRSGKI